MTRKEPKVLGFYKEGGGDEELNRELKGDQDEFYVEISSGFRNSDGGRCGE